MIIRKLRLQHGWSQEQLAVMSGLSIRTIQRIERGQKAGLESLKSLAAVFEVDISQLQNPQKKQETDMNAKTQLSSDEQQAMEYVRDVKSFYSHLISYVLVVAFLFIINYITSPGYIWAWWTAMGWGIGVICHGVNVFEIFDFFGPAWEKKQIEKKWVKNYKAHSYRMYKK